MPRSRFPRFAILRHEGILSLNINATSGWTRQHITLQYKSVDCMLQLHLKEKGAETYDL
jgi:hypothetical protein